MAETIKWEQDADGIVLLTLDDPNQSANTMNRAYAESMAATVDRLEAERDSITGVVISPSVGGWMPARIDKSVVLPAPLGPITATSSLGYASKLTSRSATRAP